MLELDGGIGKKTDFGGAFTVYDAQGRARAMLHASDDFAVLSLFDGKGDIRASLGPGLLDISDGEGFEAAMGTQALESPRTGETHKTSAASLVLYDKGKKVLWKAP